MPTRVYLIRHGVTAWHSEGRILGQRDLALDAAGVAQATAIATALGNDRLGEVVASPLVRAIQTAELLGRQQHIEVARDPRLADLKVGAWEGKRWAEVLPTPEWQRFVASPTERAPGGESLAELATRATGALDQILGDNPSGAAIAVVTHAEVIRVLLAHHLGAPLAAARRLSIPTGSISVLDFAGAATCVLAVGWTPDLSRVIHA